MSATRLLVLGVVRMHGQTHGYRVMRELLSWSADKWANLQPGSVYHALKKGVSEGLLEPLSETKGSGPSKTSYRLTDEGAAEFFRLIARYLSEPDQVGYNLSAALVFMPCLSRARVIGLLEQLLPQLEGQAAAGRHAGEHATEWGQPEHVTVLYRYWETHQDASIRWLRGVLAELRAGEYALADDIDEPFGTAGQRSE